MSCSYADGLSPYENKGKLGLKEIFDSADVVKSKVKKLAGWIEEASHVVIHTGAGISTSAGIPDFRGPQGVWTLEAKGEKPNTDISFDEAAPTVTHMAILKLVQTGHVKYVVSQNIDGLHLKSGLSRDNLSELHGNMYIEECKTCNRQFVMEEATKSVGQKSLGRRCPSSGKRPCRGKTYDTILDWEAGLPEQDLDMAYYHSTVADLNICLGTTLQINPSGNLPLNGKKKQPDSKLVICNLQPTKHDRKADLIINTYVDDVMSLLMGFLDLKIDSYTTEINPIKFNKTIDWTISEKHMKEIKTRYQQVLKDSKNNSPAKRKKTKSNYEEDAMEDVKKPKTEDLNSSKLFNVKVKKENNLDLAKSAIKIENSACDIHDKSKNITDEDKNSTVNHASSSKNGDNDIKDEALSENDEEEICDEIITESNENKNKVVISELNEKTKADDEVDSGFSETPDEI